MSYAHVNIADLEDQAPGFMEDPPLAARMARGATGAKGIGLAHYDVKPDREFAFGHRHKSMEEMYVVLAGSGRMRIDDDVVELNPHDVVYVEPQSWRNWAAGPDGLEMLAFGTHVEGDDESEMDQDFAVG